MKFAKLPAQAITDERISDFTLRVLAYLCDIANKDGECWPKQGTIADSLRAHRVSVNKSIQQLETLGYITITRTRSACRYSVALELHHTVNEKLQCNPSATSRCNPSATSLYKDEQDLIEQDTDSSLRSLSDAPVKPDAQPPPDLKFEIFGTCRRWLETTLGKPDGSQRALLGRWCRDYGDGAVLEALMAAQRESPISPVDWITKALQAKGGTHGKTTETQQSDRAARAARLIARKRKDQARRQSLADSEQDAAVVLPAVHCRDGGGAGGASLVSA